jgi:CheY-like chemotaxis protein
MDPQTKNKKVILIVEDDEIINIAYKQALEGAGFNTIFATTGDQGCNLIKQHHPDLILIDIMLKGKLNGFDVLTTIKADDKTKDIPVFIMTNLDNSYEKEALDLGANKFFVKANVSLYEMIDEIRTII